MAEHCSTCFVRIGTIELLFLWKPTTGKTRQTNADCQYIWQATVNKFMCNYIVPIIFLNRLRVTKGNNFNGQGPFY